MKALETKTQDNQTNKNSRTSAVDPVRFFVSTPDSLIVLKDLSEILSRALNFTNSSQNSNCAKNLAKDK